MSAKEIMRTKSMYSRVDYLINKIEGELPELGLGNEPTASGRIGHDS
jgi:hypothetical protein